MRQSIRLIGHSRAFTEDLRQTLEDGGLRARVEKAGPGVPRDGRSPAVNIFEVRTRADLTRLSRMKSARPFLLYSTRRLPPARLAPLKEKGLIGVLSRGTSPEEIRFLLSKAFFYKNAARKNRRALVKIPIVLKTDSKMQSALASNLSRDGLFIITLDPLPVDTKCDLEFKLPGERKRLITEGKVLYHIFVNPDLNIIASPRDPFKRLITHPGMAVLFTSLPHEERERIDRYISGLHF